MNQIFTRWATRTIDGIESGCFKAAISNVIFSISRGRVGPVPEKAAMDRGCGGKQADGDVAVMALTAANTVPLDLRPRFQRSPNASECNYIALSRQSPLTNF
jgi:hypothetical protein